MSKKIIQIDIDKEELKKKLDIRDGKDGKDGKPGKQGPKGKDGKNVTTEIIKEVIKEVDIDYTVIKNTPDIPQIVRLMTKDMSSKDTSWGEVKGTITDQTDLVDYIADQLATQDTLQEVTDNGATTTNTITVPSIQFDTTANVTVGEGEIAWNATDETLDLGMPNSITLQIGQENQIKVRNNTGGTLLNGKPVYESGMLGNRPTVAYARGNTETTGRLLGILTQDITNNDDGKVTTSGYVRNINTTGSPYGETWADGDILWVSKTTAGALTNIEPTAPHHCDIVGNVVNAHATQGSILVRVRPHTTLDELADVNGTALTTTGQFPSWNNTSGYFDFDKNIADYVPYTGATNNVNLNTKNLIFGIIKSANITGTQNIFNGRDEYYAVNTGNQYLRYLASAPYTFWYYPASLANPPSVSVGDTWYYISNGVGTALTVATATQRVQGPVTGWDLTFNETYTPANSDYIQKFANLTYSANALVSTKSYISGSFNGLNSYAVSAFVSGDSNSDTMGATSPLFILGNSNITKGGVYIGGSNSNTRSTTSNPNTLKTIMIGNTNSDSSSSFNSHFMIGDSNSITGTAGVVNILGSSNTTSTATYITGASNTVTGDESAILGSNNTVSGQFSIAIGRTNKARAYGEVVLGFNSEDVTALNATGYNALDWQLRLGAGTGISSPTNSLDIFRIRKNGEMWQYLQSATAVGHTIKLAGSHTADAIQIQNSSGTVLSAFNASGGLILGGTTASARLHTISTTEQLRVGYDVSNYYSTTVASDGLVTFNAVGSGSEFLFSDRVRQPGTFAEIYVADGSTSQSIASGTTYTKLTAFTTNGSSANCTADATNDKITITKAGKYLVACTVSGHDGVAGATFKMALFYDGVEQNNIHSTNKFNAGSEIDAITMSGILNASANKDIDVRLAHDAGGAVNFTTNYANLSITYIGE